MRWLACVALTVGCANPFVLEGATQDEQQAFEGIRRQCSSWALQRCTTKPLQCVREHFAACMYVQGFVEDGWRWKAIP